MVTTEQLTAFVIVVLAFLNLYNVFASARRNARAEKKRQEAPTETLKSEIIEVNRKLATDKLRLDEHERRLADLKNGMTAQCAGVQALLEHELHNGNADEMQAASRGIDKWLRERS